MGYMFLLICPWNLPHLMGWSLNQMRLYIIFIMNMVERLVLLLEKNVNKCKKTIVVTSRRQERSKYKESTSRNKMWL